MLQCAAFSPALLLFHASAGFIFLFPLTFFPLLNCSFPSGVSYCRYFITVFFKHLTHHLVLVHPFLSAALNLLVKWWRIDPASRSWRLLRLGERSFSISPAFHQLCSHAACLHALLFRSHSLTTGHQLAASPTPQTECVSEDMKLRFRTLVCFLRPHPVIWWFLFLLVSDPQHELLLWIV